MVGGREGRGGGWGCAGRLRNGSVVPLRKELRLDDVRREQGGLGGGEAALEVDAVVALLFVLHVTGGVELGHDVVAGVRDEKFVRVKGVGDLFAAAGVERFKVLAGMGADENRVGREVAGVGDLFGRGGVDFVEDGDGGFVGRAEFAEDGERGFVVFGDGGVGDVEDVNQKIGDKDFFERGLEGFDETVGEAADKTDGVGDEEFLVVGQQELPRGGVERGEEFVFGEDGGAGEFIEEGGFAGVGVADDGGGGDGDAEAAAALGVALLDDVFELGFELGDAVVDEAAVLFELSFAFAAHAALTALAGQVSPRAGEARE